MSNTVLSSATREVVIGFERPFVMIGERINPTGRKLLAEEMKNGDFSRVEADALAQVAAGAHMLDVNAGIPLADEPALLARAIELVQSVTDVPLSIDSSIVAHSAVRQGRLKDAFCLDFEDRAFSELDKASLVAKQLGIALHRDQTRLHDVSTIRCL